MERTMFALTQLKSFRPPFSKSAEPTGNQRTHIAPTKPSGTLYISQRAIKESFRPPFSKGGEVKGAKPLSLSAESETLLSFVKRRRG